MFKVAVNKTGNYSIQFNEDGAAMVDGVKFQLDELKVNEKSFHIIKNNKSFSAEILEINEKEKSFVIEVNNNRYELNVKDKYDELLKSLGMDSMTKNTVKEIKAPMPGLVLEVRVKEGDEIKKGDAVLVLEAMKMENIIKSPTDGIVSKINIMKGMAVEKNTVLINL